jgi:D-beta-D-heptose 7-phosphate kinase / D-beta-D-heptose 1-phosphate adenosyltransferase
MSALRLVVVGDAMLDRDVEGDVDRICPEAPVAVVDETGRNARPGGAALSAAMAAGDGADVALVTALGRDDAGQELRTALEDAGVEVLDLGSDGTTPEKIRLRSDGHTLLRLDRGGRARARLGPLGSRPRSRMAGATVMLVSDYGRGITSHPDVRRLLGRMAADVPVVWDPHPRGREPVPGVALGTPNDREAATLADGVRGNGLRASASRAGVLRERWRAGAVAVTLGAAGAVLDLGSGQPVMVPSAHRATGDPCGAGDRFAATAALRLGLGEPVGLAVPAAVAEATRHVAGDDARPGPRPHPEPAQRLGRAMSLARAARERGEVVVATSGCFDLLHPGHVATLEAARRLGDRLVVLLNSDSSVEALKGPDRPIVPQDDRAFVLEGLACVDAVVIFPEATPVAMLEQIRPDVFAKGGDYAGRALPEEAAMRRFGGQTAILPTVDGRSTSRLITRCTEGPTA